MQAREYQSFAVRSLYDYFGRNTGNPVLAMPTGTGKSVVIALFLQSIYAQFSSQRVMVLTHVKELIQQNFDKLKAVWPQAPAGIHSAGLNKKDVLQRIIFGGIASVAKKAAQFGKVDLLIIDEAHLVSPNDETMYRGFIDALKVTNPYLKVIGLTATPWRLGHGKITDDGIFTDVCFDMTSMQAFNWLIEQGYLCPLVPKATRAMLDTDGVHMRGGEFIANELQNAVDKHHITEAALKETLEYGHDRHSWLLFCAGVEHAIHVADMLSAMGVPCKAVHSKMKDAERDETIAEWKAGKLRAIANNNVMTTGVDHPALDLIVMLRPTASPVLWVQMLGRGTRPFYAPGWSLDTGEERRAAIANSQKTNCLVLDFAGNTRRLGPINDPVIPRKKGEKGGDAPVKCCEHCGVWNHASVRICAHCGTPFPEVHIKIKASAGTEELIKIDVPIVEVRDIDHVTYSLHTKTGRPPMVRVTYYCGINNFSEFVCVEHDGYAGRKARLWWNERGRGPVPATALDLLEQVGDLRTPTHLEAWVNKKYPEIMRFCFDGTAFGRQAAVAVAPTVSTYDKKKSMPGDKPTDLSQFDDDIPF
jgi:DNA repair protein RadD